MDNYSEQSGWVCPRDESINYGATCSICGGSRPAPTIKVRDHCPSCGKAIPIGAESCPNCGWGTTTRWLCPHCGTANENGRVTCKNCQQPHELSPAPALHRNGGMLAWSIVVAILFSRIAGIVAITKTNKANQSTSRAEELKHLHSAKVWNIVGCVIGTLIIIGQVAKMNINSTKDDTTGTAPQITASSDSLSTVDTILEDDGTVVKCRVLDDGTSVNEKYDKDGNLISIIYVYQDGRLFISDFGETYRDTWSYPDGTGSTTTYDENHRRESIVFWDSNTEETGYYYVFDYNSDGTSHTVVCYDGDGNLAYEATYTNGEQVSENWYVDDQLTQLEILAGML